MMKMYDIVGVPYYTQGGFTVTITAFKSVRRAIVVSTDPLYQVQMEISQMQERENPEEVPPITNQVLIRVFKFVVDEKGDVILQEVAEGIDLQDVTFRMVVEGD